MQTTRSMSFQLIREGFDDRRLRQFAMLAFFGEGRRLVDFAANDVARDDDDEAQQERNAPAPAIERFVGHVVRERQEYRRGQDLPGLHALQREAREEAAPAERRVLENHRAGARDFAGDREALDQTQHDQQHRRQQAHLLRRSAAGRRPSSRSPSGTCRRAAPSCGRGCRPSDRERTRRSAARRSRRRRSPAMRRWRSADRPRERRSAERSATPRWRR